MTDFLVLMADLARCAQGEILASVMLVGNDAASCSDFLAGGFVDVLSYLHVREYRVIRVTVRENSCLV